MVHKSLQKKDNKYLVLTKFFSKKDIKFQNLRRIFNLNLSCIRIIDFAITNQANIKNKRLTTQLDYDKKKYLQSNFKHRVVNRYKEINKIL